MEEILLQRRLCVGYHFCFSVTDTNVRPLDLTKYGSRIHVLVRRDELRASKIMAKRLLNNPKVVCMTSD